MSAPPWQRVKEVFQEALLRAPEARSAFLDEACEADAELRREVESLLAAHQGAGAFLSAPGLVATDPTATAQDAAAEPRRIGPYRVLGLIARGGMGNVRLCGTGLGVARHVQRVGAEPGYGRAKDSTTSPIRLMATSIAERSVTHDAWMEGETSQGRAWRPAASELSAQDASRRR